MSIPLLGPDPDAFAALVCDWSLGVKPRDQILISSTTLAEAAVLATHRAVLERDAWPIVRLTPTELQADFYRSARERHFDGFAPLELTEAQAVDGVLRINAPANTRALAAVDPHLITRLGRARRPIQEAVLSRRWCGTQWPTAALAQEAGMGEREYAAFVTRALFLDAPDPVHAWRALSQRQARLVQRLSTAEEIHIEAEGTDLTLNVAGRTWINSDGKHNMPSGEVFTGPHEHSANGTIRFDIPSNPRGVEVVGVELTFHGGEVVKAQAERGEEYLHAALAIDAGARYVGELGIGTNDGIDRPTGSILFDEKMAGTVHVALGRSYPETGAENESALHWDLICDLRDGGRVNIDGQPLDLQPRES